MPHLVAFCAAMLAAGTVAPAPCSAQRNLGRLLGVYDDATGQPIAGAEVLDIATGTKGTTSVSGAISLAFLEPGPTVLQIRKLGYKMRMLTVVVSPRDTTSITLTLNPLGQALPAVVTKGAAQNIGKLAEFERRRAAGFGKFITSEMFEKNANRQTGDIMTLLAGARIVRPSSNVAYVATTRGSSRTGPCYSTVIVDGVVVYNQRQPKFDVNTIPPEQIAGIEFYAGASTAPVEYNLTGNACGVVVIWTRT